MASSVAHEDHGGPDNERVRLIIAVGVARAGPRYDELVTPSTHNSPAQAMLEQQQQQQAGGVATSAAREAREPSAGLQTRPQSQSHLPTGPPQQAAATPTKLDSQQQEEQTRHASTPQQQAQAPQGPPPSQGSSVPASSSCRRP